MCCWLCRLSWLSSYENMAFENMTIKLDMLSIFPIKKIFHINFTLRPVSEFSLLSWHLVNKILLENAVVDIFPNQKNIHKGSTKRTLSQIVVFKLNIFVFMCEKGPLYWFYVFFAYVEFIGDHFFLLSTDSTYSRIPGDKWGSIFSDLGFFFALVLCSNWCTTICITCPILRKIECIKFVCNDFLLVLIQIDLIQFEKSICIRSIWTKTNTNSVHTYLIHSISRKIGHVIQIVVHQFVHKTSAKKNS